MKKLTEYDLRQIILIEKKIHLFENNKLNLFEIISDLGGLLHALESVPDSWKNDFQTQINSLEMIHDSIEDGSISRWNGNYKEEIRHAMTKLKLMTISILEEYLQNSDSNILEIGIEADSNWLICPKCNNAWISNSLKEMVICPKCGCALHNPRNPAC
ncbi:MAG: hypothetical protein AB7H48_00395 [Parachlamydiales bacterium]